MVPRLVALALSAVLSVAPGLLLLLNVLAEEAVEFPQCPEGGTQVGIAAGLRRRLLLCLVAVVVGLGLVVGVPGDGEEARVQVAVGVPRLAEQGTGDNGEDVTVAHAHQVSQEAAAPTERAQGLLHTLMEAVGQRDRRTQRQPGVAGLPLAGTITAHTKTQ